MRIRSSIVWGQYEAKSHAPFSYGLLVALTLPIALPVMGVVNWGHVCEMPLIVIYSTSSLFIYTNSDDFVGMTDWHKLNIRVQTVLICPSIIYDMHQSTYHTM